MKKEVMATIAVVGAFSTLSAGDINSTIKPKVKKPIKDIKKEPKKIKGFKKKELEKIFGQQEIKKPGDVASRSYGWDKVVPNR